jgi:hypothetical protein
VAGVGVCVETGLMMESVVEFSGAQPIEKFVELPMLKVGHASREVTVTVFMDLQPFTRLVVCRLYTPGGMVPDKTLMLLFELAMGTPPGKGFSGLYQSCCILTVGLLAVPEKVTGLPELQVITWLAGFTVLVGAMVFTPMLTT